VNDSTSAAGRENRPYSWKSCESRRKSGEKKNENQGTLDRQAQGNMTTPCGIGIVKEDCSKDPGPRQPESERNGAAAQK